MEESQKPQIKDLFPNLSETEHAEAETNLEQYLSLVLRIFERVESEANAQAGQLTPGTSTLGCTPPELRASE